MGLKNIDLKAGYNDNEVKECRNEISSVIQKLPFLSIRGYWGFEYEVSIAAYTLFRACDSENPMEYSYEDDKNIDEEILELIHKSNIKKIWKDLSFLTQKYNKNVFAEVVDFRKMEESFITPESIQALSEKILQLKGNDSFADFCCGSGIVVSDIKRNNPDIDAYGFDIRKNSIALAKIEKELKDIDIHFETKDVFELRKCNEYEKRFDKIFSNYPFGVRLRELDEGKEYLEELSERIPTLSKATSSDWLFNMLLVDMLSDDGKAIGIMTNGSTWNRIDTKVRKYFVEKGYIESVIALPSRMFSETSIATSLIILSHNNKDVRLVDASEMYVPGRRFNEFDESIIDSILYALNNDCEYSINVNKKELSENDYVLNLSRYKNVDRNIENGQQFENVIKRITRGASIRAKELDECTSQEQTDNQYLMLANIHDGLINEDLPYLKYIDKKNEKYCLTNRCLLLSKNGYPYKVAVAEVKENQKILATGNLYIIELDEEKMDPYYMAAYLNSEQGIASLKSITVGATIPNIGVEQLKKLIVPVPELSKQREIGEKYKTVRDEIVMLQLKLERAKSKMASIYGEEK